jgi:uncharacterized membrane protein YhiD involved in acid resistance
MAIEIEKVRNKNSGPIFVVLAIFFVVVFLVFLSVRKNLGMKIDKDNVKKVINKETLELENINKNLDKNIDSIFQREDFQALYKHNDILGDYEIGKPDPFKSF